jgi:hypothetical protein
MLRAAVLETPRSRQRDLRLKVLVHNLMLLRLKPRVRKEHDANLYIAQNVEISPDRFTAGKGNAREQTGRTPAANPARAHASSFGAAEPY